MFLKYSDIIKIITKNYIKYYKTLYLNDAPQQ